MTAPGGPQPSRRTKISEGERLKVWVRSGGRCAICNRYLLEGDLGASELTFGEMAHIVGQQASERSPRGLEDLDSSERDNADNIVLLCDDEHDEIDKPGSREKFSVDFLRQLKREHEERIQHVTGLAGDRRSTVLRMIGVLRGDAVEVDRDMVSTAVIGDGNRFPKFSLAYDRQSIEIDLRHCAGEDLATPEYYTAATAIIDEVISQKLREGIVSEEISHLSVFAFARLPLLVYLGSKLDDTVPTEIYQRHRASETWNWPDIEADAAFDIRIPVATPGVDEGVLVINVSGSIQHNELPDALVNLPYFELLVTGVTPSPDVLRGAVALTSFASICRRLLAEIEATHKQIRLLHVFAAIPLSAGVAFGRVFDPSVHPSVLIYDRSDSGYRAALRIGQR